MIAHKPALTIECIHWTIPVAVGFWDGKNYYEFVKSQEDDNPLKEFLTFLKGNMDKYEDFKIVSVEGAKYTHKLLLTQLIKDDETVEPQFGNRRLVWKIEHTNRKGKFQKIYFEDSLNHLGGWSIDKLPTQLNDKLMEEILGESNYRSLQVEPPTREYKNPLGTFRAYLMEATLKLSEAVTRLHFFHLGVFASPPTVTFATSVHNMLYNKFLKDLTIDPNVKWEDNIREAIYGGRNEVYKRYGENINAYDVHWMFGSHYDRPVPIGPMEPVKEDRMSLENGTLARATVHVPEDLYIGPLPYKGGPHKPLLFPVGTFEDTWDMVELRNAVIKYGVKIIKFHQMWECEEQAILEDFLTFMKDFVKKYPELAPIIKEYLISPSGKFGQRREGSRYVHWSEIPNKNYEFLIPVGDTETFFEQFHLNTSPRIVPAITMRIRALARITHLDLIQEALDKGGEVFYGDTDSLYTTAILPYYTLEVGKPRLIEGGIQRGYFIRQKLYATVSAKGRFQQKSAGYSDVKLTEEDFKGLLNGREVEVETENRALGLKQLLTGKEQELLLQHQYITSNSTKTRIEEGDNTKPIILGVS